MHVVFVDAFWPFTYVAIEGENFWGRGNSLQCYPYRDNVASVFNGWNLGILSIGHGKRVVNICMHKSEEIKGI